jgi:uncharacterized peroxidase-related enzyme
MSRIQPVDPARATEPVVSLLAAVERNLGGVPNFIRVLAHSSAALQAFLGLHGIAGDGSLEPLTRERIALAVAEQNGCEYCVSAHTAIGRKVGLDSAEMLANRQGASADARAAAALAFAGALVANMGEVTTAEVEAVRAAGYDDAQIVEIIAHVALNIFTNLLGKAARIDIDFPRVALREAA